MYGDAIPAATIGRSQVLSFLPPPTSAVAALAVVRLLEPPVAATAPALAVVRLLEPTVAATVLAAVTMELVVEQTVELVVEQTVAAIPVTAALVARATTLTAVPRWTPVVNSLATVEPAALAFSPLELYYLLTRHYTHAAAHHPHSPGTVRRL